MFIQTHHRIVAALCDNSQSFKRICHRANPDLFSQNSRIYHRVIHPHLPQTIRSHSNKITNDPTRITWYSSPLLYHVDPPHWEIIPLPPSNMINTLLLLKAFPSPPLPLPNTMLLLSSTLLPHIEILSHPPSHDPLPFFTTFQLKRLRPVSYNNHDVNDTTPP